MGSYTIDRRQMKLDARDAMRTHKPSVYMVTFVFLLITLILDTLSAKLQFPGMKLSEIMRFTYQEDQIMALWQAAAHRSASSRLLDLAVTIMSAMLTGGFTLFCLRVSQRREAGVGTLFDLFAWFFRFLWLNILIGIFIFLWSLLLVIPGIIAAYRYSMAIFIFLDDPEKGALQCIGESKAMTQGYKGQIFVLDLSFIGWALLSVIPLVNIFTAPYMMVTRANYYRALSDNLRRQEQQYYGDPWRG